MARAQGWCRMSTRQRTRKLLTNSRLKVFQQCQRLHHWRYNERVIPLTEESVPLRFGNLWHAGQEYYWHAIKAGAAPDDALGIAVDTIDSYTEGVDEFDRAKARALMIGYHVRWASSLGRWRVLAIEEEFRTRLSNPATGYLSRRWDLGGKVDLLIEILDGPHAGAYLLDHKSTTEDFSPGSDYWTKLQLDSQITTYYTGALALGYQVRGFVYDVAKRPTQEPLKATPHESRKYTKAKACKECAATAKATAKAEGRKLSAADVPVTEGCDDCQPPRLYAYQRDTDETPAEHFERVAAAIEANPDSYFARTDPPIVRLEDELDRLRQNTWDVASSMATKPKGLPPMSTGACRAHHRLCEYFPVCSGAADIDDPTQFHRREHAHAELSASIQNQGNHDSDSSESANDNKPAETEAA